MRVAATIYISGSIHHPITEYPNDKSNNDTFSTKTFTKINYAIKNSATKIDNAVAESAGETLIAHTVVYLQAII